MRKKLKKKLLDIALSITVQLHWHTLFFGLLEKHSDMAEEIAIESYKLPPQEEKQMLDEILRRRKLEIARREAFKMEEAITSSRSKKRPDSQ